MNPPRSDELAVGIELLDLVATFILNVYIAFGVNRNTLISQTITRVCGAAIPTITRTLSTAVHSTPFTEKLSIRIELLNPFVPTSTRRHVRRPISAPIHDIHNAARGISRESQRGCGN